MPATFSPDILVTDVSRSIRFLTEALGFTESRRMGPEGAPIWAALERDGQRIMIETYLNRDRETRDLVERAGNRVHATVHFYLSVDDLDAEIARLRAASVRFTGPEVQPYGMKEVRFQDPDGYSWMIGQMAEDK